MNQFHGIQLFCHLLPGERAMIVVGSADKGGCTFIMVSHPTRSPVTLWRDAAGILREELVDLTR